MTGGVFGDQVDDQVEHSTSFGKVLGSNPGIIVALFPLLVHNPCEDISA